MGFIAYAVKGGVRMAYLKTVIEVIMALFAVIGIYSLSRLLSQKYFGSLALAVAVDLSAVEDPRDAERAIREGMAQFLLAPSGRIVILMPEQWKDDTALQAILSRYALEDRVRMISSE